MKGNRKLLKEVLKEIRHDMTNEEVLNLLTVKAFDPFPFILLNLVLSCVAAIQAPLIMMSQNRQEEKIANVLKMTIRLISKLRS